MKASATEVPATIRARMAAAGVPIGTDRALWRAQAGCRLCELTGCVLRVYASDRTGAARDDATNLWVWCTIHGVQLRPSDFRPN